MKIKIENNPIVYVVDIRNSVCLVVRKDKSMKYEQTDNLSPGLIRAYEQRQKVEYTI